MSCATMSPFIGELEPVVYVRDYFLGDGATLGFYLSTTPFSKTAVTVFIENYTDPQLNPTLWQVTDPNGKVSVSGGQLQISGGPATVSYVEKLELAGGMMMQHGLVVFNAASSGTIGGIYNGAVGDGNCIAGFSISPNGSNCNIQALVNGGATGTPLTTTPGHQYAFATQLFCNEAHRVHQTYLSSTHPAGNGRGGDSVAAAMRVVLTVHDIDPNNPGTLAAPATVLFDDVLAAPRIRDLRAHQRSEPAGQHFVHALAAHCGHRSAQHDSGRIVPHAAGGRAGGWRRVLREFDRRAAVLYALSAAAKRADRGGVPQQRARRGAGAGPEQHCGASQRKRQRTPQLRPAAEAAAGADLD